jgi:hypothetical protein
MSPVDTHIDSLSEEWKDQLPTERTDEAHQRRQAIFQEYFDRNGNGFCSLAECDAGIKDILPNCLLFASPVILRAFQAARTLSEREGDADFLDFSEFRMFLSYLKEFGLLWQTFDQIDSEGEKDRRISFHEFLQAHTKFVKDFELQLDESAEATFASIDTNGGGFILFVEFVDWAVQQKLKGNKGE